MDELSDEEHCETQTKCITDLPEEILEYILMKVSPYNDLKSAMMVSTLWFRLAKGVQAKLHQHYLQSMKKAEVTWTPIHPEVGSRITERYSHCSCYYNKSVYIFGGCTSSNTTLNDLWRFDLSTREWIRPLAMGTYPFPKACASMVVYKDSLVLFGGWSHPLPFPLHQAAQFFSELYTYSPLQNRWTLITTLNPSPKPTAGHSASVVGDKMVVFGGSHATGVRTNDLWVFDFTSMSWKKPRVGNKKIPSRYGQSQVTIDENHILILGGCGGPNQIFSDCWLLTMTSVPWEWSEVKVTNMDSAAPQIWCHPACKVGDMLVVLSKPAKPSGSTATSNKPMKFQSNRVWVPPRPMVSRQKGNQGNSPSNPAARSEENAQQPVVAAVSRGENSNNVALRTEQSMSHDASHDSDSSQSKDGAPPVNRTLNPRGGLPSIRPNAMKNRQRQLEALLKYEKKLRRSGLSNSMDTSDEDGSPPPYHPIEPQPSTSGILRQQAPKNPDSVMTAHVLDLSKLLETPTVEWQPLQLGPSPLAPEESIFYSLVEGRAELVMFGGIEQDMQTMQRGQGLKSHVVSNTLYLINPWSATL